VLAAKGATTTIPIVFEVSRDPVQMGLVATFNRPGGNITGVFFLTQELEAKRLALLLGPAVQFFLAHFVFGSPGFDPVVCNSRYAASSG
jgi:putative ABC transport system substrate-binding protein